MLTRHTNNSKHSDSSHSGGVHVIWKNLCKSFSNLKKKSVFQLNKNHSIIHNMFKPIIILNAVLRVIIIYLCICNLLKQHHVVILTSNDSLKSFFRLIYLKGRRAAL